MSRHHLILEANCEIVRLRDVGSANGTFVNETRINALELRAGDQIRAGSTVMELSILADHEDPHARDGLTITSLSQRTLGSNQAGANPVGPTPVGANTVQPGVANPAIESPVSADQSANQSANQSADQTQDSAIPSLAAPPAGTRVVRYQPSSVPDAVHDEEVTMRLEMQWWMPHFQPSPVPNLFEQRAAEVDSITFLDIMRQLPASNPIGLVANCSKLSKGAMEILYRSVDNRLVTPLSNALLLLRCDGSPAIWSFVQHSMHLDAMICLAAETEFQRAWLSDLLDQLSYPSMLASLLRSGNQALQQRLQEHLALALFERSRSGELGLYINPRHLPR